MPPVEMLPYWKILRAPMLGLKNFLSPPWLALLLFERKNPGETSMCLELGPSRGCRPIPSGCFFVWQFRTLARGFLVGLSVVGFVVFVCSGLLTRRASETHPAPEGD